MKPETDVKALKRKLYTLYVAAYMQKRRLQNQNTRIRALIDELHEAGVGYDELIDIKLEAFYTANPTERMV